MAVISLVAKAGDELPVTAELRVTGGVAPYTYEIVWFDSVAPDITFYFVSDNEIRFNVGVDVASGVYNGVIRGTGYDSEDREDFDDLELNITVIEDIFFMAAGADYDGFGLGSPRGVFINGDDLSYIASDVFTTVDGPLLAPAWDSPSYDGRVEIAYVPTKDHWVFSGTYTDNWPAPDGAAITILGSGEAVSVSTVIAAPDTAYLSYGLAQDPADPEHLLAFPSLINGGYRSRTPHPIIMEATDGETFVRKTETIKDHATTGAFGRSPAWGADDLIFLPSDTFDFSYERFSPNSGYIPGMIGKGNDLYGIKTPGFSAFNTFQNVVVATIMAGGSVDHNGQGEWFVASGGYFASGQSVPGLVYSPNNGDSWVGVSPTGLNQSNTFWARVRYINDKVFLINAWNGRLAISTDNGQSFTDYDVFSDLPWTTLTREGYPIYFIAFDVAYDDVNDRYLLAGTSYRQSNQDPITDAGTIVVIDDINDIANSISVFGVGDVELFTSIKSNRPNTAAALPAPIPQPGLVSDILRVNFESGTFEDLSPLEATWTAEGTRPPVVFSEYVSELNTTPKNGSYSGRVRGRNFYSWTNYLAGNDIRCIEPDSFTWRAAASDGVYAGASLGTSWTFNTTAASPLNSITQTRHNLGVFIAVGNNGLIRRSNSTAAGATWSTVTTSSFGATNINGVTSHKNIISGWTNRRYSVAVGNEGKIGISLNTGTAPNDGASWSQQASPFGASNIYCIETNQRWTFMAGGADGKLARGFLNLNASIVDFVLVDSTFDTTAIRSVAGDVRGVWVAVGDEGKMARSSDNGVTWAPIISPFGESNILSVATDYKGTFMAGGADGKAALSSDFGMTWELMDLTGVFSSADTIKTVSFAENRLTVETDLQGNPTDNWIMGGSNGVAVSRVEVQPQQSYWASPSSTNYHFAENESFTIQFWIHSTFPLGKYYLNFSNSTDYQVIVGAGSLSTTPEEGWWGILLGEDRSYDRRAPIRFEVFNGSTHDFLEPALIGDVDPDSWHHIAVVREGGSQLRIYYNGVLAATSDNPTFQRALNAYDQIFIGSCLRNPSIRATNWNGAIDDIRITKGLALYAADFIPPGRMV